MTPTLLHLSWRGMWKIVNWRSLLSVALIGALLSPHAAFAMPLCDEVAPPSAGLVAPHTEADCLAAAVAEPSLCAQASTDTAKSPGPAGPNVPLVAVASALLLPQAPASLDPAAIHCRSTDRVPRPSTSVLFCRWLS